MNDMNHSEHGNGNNSHPDQQHESNTNTNNNPNSIHTPTSNTTNTSVIGSAHVRPVFIGNLDSACITEDLEDLFERPVIDIGPKPIAVDRVDMKRGYCFVFLQDVDSEEEKDRIERYVTDLNGMSIPKISKSLRVEFARGDGRIKRKEDDRRRNIHPSETLFVVNFSEETTKREDLEMLFSPFGELVRIDMKRNYAFVQFTSVENATKAKDATNGGKLDQSVITVEYVAQRMDSRRDGGGGGGGGYSYDRSRGYDRDRSDRYDRGGDRHDSGRGGRDFGGRDGGGRRDYGDRDRGGDRYSGGGGGFRGRGGDRYDSGRGGSSGYRRGGGDDDHNRTSSSRRYDDDNYRRRDDQFDDDNRRGGVRGRDRSPPSYSGRDRYNDNYRRDRSRSRSPPPYRHRSPSPSPPRGGGGAREDRFEDTGRSTGSGTRGYGGGARSGGGADNYRDSARGSSRDREYRSGDTRAYK